MAADAETSRTFHADARPTHRHETTATEPPKLLPAHRHETTATEPPKLLPAHVTVLRFVAITAWILQALWWLYVTPCLGGYIEPSDNIAYFSGAALGISTIFVHVPWTTRARLCLQASMLYSFSYLSSSILWHAATASQYPPLLVPTRIAAVYIWVLITLLVWGAVVAIGPQDSTDFTLPYWVKEILPYGIAKHIKTNNGKVKGQ